MAGRHPLHNTPKIQSIGVYTIHQLTGLWISEGRMKVLSFKNKNISAEEYQLCQRAWQDNDMKTMKEFMTWYNKDVEPMLEAIDKMFQFNLTMKHDARAPSDVVLVQVVQIFILLIRYGEVVW
jgi:hypothetical protein